MAKPCKKKRHNGSDKTYGLKYIKYSYSMYVTETKIVLKSPKKDETASCLRLQILTVFGLFTLVH